MPADDPKFGINRFPGEFIDEVKVTDKNELAIRKNRVGISKRIFAHDPTADISIKGGGTPALALGVIATPGVTGLATGGLFVVKERTHTQKQEFDEFDLSATHFPSGEAGVAVT